MTKLKNLAIIILFCIGMHGLYAQTDESTINPATKKAIDKAVFKIAKQVDKKIPVSAISQSPIPGIFQVTSDLNVFYVSENGEYAFFGDLISIDKNMKNWSLTEKTSQQLRAAALANLNTADMIIFPATKAKIGTVSVFTDIDCPYCRKMQELMPEYNKLGIEVRYLSFPRAGVKSKSFDEAVRVWCAKDKAQAYDLAVEKKEYPKETCKKNPVASQFELGQKMGISGTPTIVLDNGTKVSGMVEPAQLAKLIKEQGPA